MNDDKNAKREPADVGEMLLALESVLEEVVIDHKITREAAKYIQDTMEMIAVEHGYI